MIEVCKGTNLSVFLQRIKQKEEMENKKPIVLNNLEEWDFTDYIDSLIQKEEAVDLEFKVAKDGLPNSLWDTYSSFANTDGGVIVLGVKEHKQQFIIEGLTKEQISQYKKDFWNQINNPDCVNENLLSDNDLYEGRYKERNLPVQTVGSALSTGQETLSVGIHLNATMKEIISVRMQKSDA